MAWTTVNLKDVNPNEEMIPEGEYKLRLFSAKHGVNGRVDVVATIVNEGEFVGRRVFPSYPNPDNPNTAWSLKAMKRLELATGIDQQDGEDVVGYLNRAAKEGAVFEAPVFHDHYTAEDGTAKTSVKVKISAVRAAA